jgi:outer membrane biosynthesis protein TonB
MRKFSVAIALAICLFSFGASAADGQQTKSPAKAKTAPASSAKAKKEAAPPPAKRKWIPPGEPIPGQAPAAAAPAAKAAPATTAAPSQKKQPAATPASKKEPVNTAAAAGCDENKDFTGELASTNDECKSKIVGGIVGTGLTYSQCTNISDGIRASCQDGNKAAIAKAITKICCHYDAKATKVKLQMSGTTMHAYFNIDTVMDPAQGVRCQLAKQLKLKNSTEDCSKHL